MNHKKARSAGFFIERMLTCGTGQTARVPT